MNALPETKGFRDSLLQIYTNTPASPSHLQTHTADYGFALTETVFV